MRSIELVGERFVIFQMIDSLLPQGLLKNSVFTQGEDLVALGRSRKRLAWRGVLASDALVRVDISLSLEFVRKTIVVGTREILHALLGIIMWTR